MASLISAFATNIATAEEDADTHAKLDTESKSTLFQKRKLGFEFANSSGRWSIHPWLRLQTRLFGPFDDDPITPDEFTDPPGGDLELRRARLKIDAQLGSPNVSLYFEHELAGDAPLLDLRVDVALPNNWQSRFGQYKVLYNRERVDSSGNQALIERSIATYAFTLDRQRGVTITKLIAPDTRAAQWFFLGVFEGDGRDPEQRGSGAMYVGRWQWNFLGHDVPFRQSDLDFLDKPAAAFALAASTVTGPYTRYSGSGGGQLDGFQTGSNDRYKLDQGLQEFAWKYRGFAVQQEFHVKKIEDQVLGARSTLYGGYLQFGKAWRTKWFGRSIVELAARYAQVDWRSTPVDRIQRELTVGSNLFFDGHNNKLTAEVGRLWLEYAGADRNADTRIRLQWDVSF